MNELKKGKDLYDSVHEMNNESADRENAIIKIDCCDPATQCQE